jgi:hypothetical protein
VNALTTGFDVPETDLLVMRRRTKSLGLYIQMVGRVLRTIGGNIEASIRTGKANGAVLDFAGNIDEHGPLDFIRPRESKLRLVSCDECGKRNPAAAVRCWSCHALMTKLCPACLESIAKYHLDCPACGHDMRRAEPGEGEAKPAKLLERPTGAALISSYRTGTERAGGWLPIAQSWEHEGTTYAKAGGEGYVTVQSLPAALVPYARAARWLRMGDSGVAAILVPNGASRTSARQITAEGAEIIVPLPAPATAEAA